MSRNAPVSLLSGELKLAGRLDARFFALLGAIGETGSINRAAATAGLSYKGAWLMLDAAGNLAQTPLVHSATGGSGGGGTQLTPAAIELLAVWRELQAAHTQFLREHDQRLASRPALHRLLRRLTMKTTARNQFAGTVSALSLGPVSLR
jgi:molybdate transport system regulatory protein